MRGAQLKVIRTGNLSVVMLNGGGCLVRGTTGGVVLCVITLVIFYIFRYRRTMYLERRYSKSNYYALQRKFAAAKCVERRTEYTDSMKKEFFTMPNGQVYLFVSPRSQVR